MTYMSYSINYIAFTDNQRWLKLTSICQSMFLQIHQFLSHLTSSVGNKAWLKLHKEDCQGNVRELSVILDPEKPGKIHQLKFEMYYVNKMLLLFKFYIFPMLLHPLQFLVQVDPERSSTHPPAGSRA